MEIKIRQLSKSYENKAVWEQLNLSIPLGGRVALMGQSGCGKTTLLRILMGLERQDSGTVEGMPPRLSAVFQEDRLCPEFSAVENVKLVMQTHKSGRRKRRENPEEEIRKHLSMLGLVGSLDKPVETLSGGMKRRVAIARAYLAPSDMLLLDEPLKGLDEATKKQTLEWMQKMRGERTVLLVTHDRREAELLTEEIFDLRSLSGAGQISK